MVGSSVPISGKKDGTSSILSQKKRKRSSKSSAAGRDDKRLSPALLDLNVLDCPICFEPFTIPIFQCENGHLACSSCCPKLNNKCPTCALPTGRIRCRAMEGVVESVSLPCPNAEYGCPENLSYGKLSTHEKEECEFSPCSCPEQDCDFTGPYKDLYRHYDSTETHNERFGWFICGEPFTAHMNVSDDKILIKRGCTFILLIAVQCFREPCGVYVTLSCFAPHSPKVREFSYDITYATEDGYSMIYKSPKVKRILEVCFETPQDNFMLIPHCLVRGDLLKLEICINELNQE
ncbi:E3 ubiquitin-protein ligase SINA-like 7 [Hirschfeldia incana]|nr:E3 ubiquitin-protein ligase SINA-like 7 [Hirschfeldia incana]